MEQGQNEMEVKAEVEVSVPAVDEFSLEMNYFDHEKQEEKLWQARTGLNLDTLCGAIETIIFMSDRPVPLVKIKKMVDDDMPLNIIHDALLRLQAEYESAHHGLRLQEVADGYQFRTKATYSKYVQDLFKVNALVLTPSALEVLAVIAYKQPVSKTDIDKIRGVDSSHLVRALMEKRLVKITGRSEELGRPSMFGTTQEFLEVFNLATLENLPPEYDLKEIAQSNDIGKIADIRQICSEGEKKRFVFDEIGELDELSESIRNIASDTDFTKSLVSEEKRKIEGQTADSKTAFEILEEYIEKQRVVEQNQKSMLSGALGVVGEAKIINDLTAGPFNLPLEEEEDFQMIDLETGKPFEDEADLTDALDDAFDKLMGKGEVDFEVTMDKAMDFNMEEAETFFQEKDTQLDNLKDSLISRGKSLDLDLNFLKDEQE